MVFEELQKYSKTGSFKFEPSDRLSAVCNVGKSGSGVYLVYASGILGNELIYIGISGQQGPEGKFKHRKDGLRGRFLTGKQFGDLRRIAWPKQMIIEGIEELEVVWFVTYDDDQYKDIPRQIEERLIAQFKQAHGRWPRWNRKD